MAKSTQVDVSDDFPDNTRSAKRVKLLSDEEDSDSGDSDGGVKVNGNSTSLNVNKEYARRFEHNSKRAELHRLEEKYGKGKAQRMQNGESESEDSTSESEDDDGALAAGALEEDFNATLQAIRNKDPRIYKSEEKFYQSDDEDGATTNGKEKNKPMFLSDYHRQNLLNGNQDDEVESELPSYDQQQNALRETLVKEMHAVEQESGESDEDGMFKVKRRAAPQIKQQPITSVDVERADQDPENFLSTFLQSRAWVTNGANGAQPFESDDDEEERRAEEFEEAYNLRFENPAGLNEKLVSHARDTAAKYSVRNEAKSQRQRARDLEKAKKEEMQSERTREKAQLKKLRMEEMEKKLEKIKEAAGAKDFKVKLDDWSEFLADDWDDDKWEEQMKSRFDDKYYAERDADLEEDEKKKVSKPEWDDDIDIGDIVKDFEDGGQFSLSEGEEEDQDTRPASKKQKKAAIEEEKKEARKNKRKLEQLAEEKANLDMIMQLSNGKGNKFKYRETSPVDWGMTSRDILLATDTQLNQFAGLKKLASFREAEKRKRDKKKLGKKARLRQWRKDTFGSIEGPTKTLQDVLREAQEEEGVPVRVEESNIIEGSGKRKRSKKTQK